jgi:L-amino acid N-acyltransferase YncA
MELRQALEADAEEILGIYGHYIRDTAITFEYVVPSPDEFRSRIRGIASDYPYLVCLEGGKVIAYGYAHRHMERAAYQWNAELSIYIDRSRLRRGVGRTLHSALVDILLMQNVRNVYGGVTLPNGNSMGLLESLGFTSVGVYHSTGYKCGAWHDVAWFEKAIGDHGVDPAPFIPLREIDSQAIREVLKRHNALLPPG